MILGYFVYVFVIFLMGILFLIWKFIMGVLSDSLFLFVLFKYGFGDKFENNIKVVKEDDQHVWAVSSHSVMYGFDNHFLKK